MLLEVDKLNTFYGNLHAIWDISIEVGEGEIVALIGFERRRKEHAAQNPSRAAYRCAAAKSAIRAGRLRRLK